MPGQEESRVLKSQHSHIRSYVVFRNWTLRPVDVIWLGFSGEQVWYGTLRPHEAKIMNTFATHPWIFRDRVTGERMHVHGKDFYMPQPSHRRQLTRFVVPIQFPMRSLSVNSLWVISGLLSTDDQVQQLEVPRSLMQDILEVRSCTQRAREFRSSQERQVEEEEAADEDP